LNGVHDTGGTDGFGAIARESDEPVFHEEWERRVFGLFHQWIRGQIADNTGAGQPPTPLDAFRHRLERLNPIRYLGSSYYERWLAGLESALVEAGTLTADEIHARLEQLATDPDGPMLRHEDPARADRLASAVRAGRDDSQRKIRQRPRFRSGDKIVTRNLNPHGHTRLPRYARGKHGIIIAHHGAHVFPDSNAHGQGENPQHLYTVRFAARELWGESAEPNQSVLIDLWESYLDKDKVASRSTARNKRIQEKRVAPKNLAPTVKISPHKASSATSAAAPSRSIARSAAGSGRKNKPGAAPAGGRRAITTKQPSGKPARRSR